MILPSVTIDANAFYQEMEHFWKGYSDEDRRGIEKRVDCREAVRNKDAIRAQEIATDFLENPFL